uniref:Pol n=1 Tax=Capsaspora owczarzaki TaxID=192875 RepID=W4P266_9EUKA|nr:TPA: Pol [Capsaspora owczarzaki]
MVKVATWNVRSLKVNSNSLKENEQTIGQQQLKRYMGSLPSLVCLQETRLLTTDEKKASVYLFKYHCFWSSNDNDNDKQALDPLDHPIDQPSLDDANSPEEGHADQDSHDEIELDTDTNEYVETRNHGAGLLVHEEDEEFKDPEMLPSPLPGRLVLVSAKMRGQKTILASVYAPASGTQRKIQFLEALETAIKNVIQPNPEEPALPLIMAGDFNITMDNTSANRTSNSDTTDSVQGRFRSLLSRLNMRDLLDEVDRKNAPLFTWERASQGKTVGSRIDFIFTSEAVQLTGSRYQASHNSRSDHAPVVGEYCHILDKPRPQAPFRLNDTLLNDPCFDHFVVHEARALQTIREPFEWEFFKARVRSYAQKRGAQLARARKQESELVSRKLRFVEKNLADPNTPEEERKALLSAHCHLRAEQKADDDRSAQGAQARSMRNWRIENERPTKLFFALERDKRKSQTIDRLVYNGQEATEPDQIANTLRDFLGTLYASEPTTQEDIDTVLEAARPSYRLTSDEQSKLGAPLTDAEIRLAIERTPKGRSPGPDGLTPAFYAKYAGILAAPLAALANVARDRGRLPESMMRGHVKVLYKKGDRASVENYRPISLLNVDCKIISRALCNRLAKVLSKIIPVAQNGFVPGRTIDANIHLFRDILDLTRHHKIPGLAVLLDSRKAFDRVAHDFLYQAMAAYSIGDSFISWMRLLNTGCQSHVVYNATVSLPFPIQRSVRQGSVEAPFLYAIYAGVISDYIQSRRNIAFLNVRPQLEPLVIKASLFADDTTIFVRNDKDAMALFKHYETVGRASNLAINQEKTTIVPLGPRRNDEIPEVFKSLGVEWIDRSKTTRVLGVMLGYGDIIKDNYEPALAKAERALHRWSSRGLSHPARVLIANTIGLSRVWYQARFVPVDQRQLEKIKNMIQRFIWRKRWPTRNLATLTAPTISTHFGLGLLDPATSSKAYLCQALVNLCTGPKSDWQMVANEIFRTADLSRRREVQRYFGLQRLVGAGPPLPATTSLFWHKALSAWAKLQPALAQPRTRDQASTTPLWVSTVGGEYNESKNRKILANSGYCYVHHLRTIDGDEERYRTKPEIESGINHRNAGKAAQWAHAKLIPRLQLDQLLEHEGPEPALRWGKTPDGVLRSFHLELTQDGTKELLGQPHHVHEDGSIDQMPEHARVVDPLEIQEAVVIKRNKQHWLIGLLTELDIDPTRIILQGRKGANHTPMLVSAPGLRIKKLRKLLTKARHEPKQLASWRRLPEQWVDIAKLSCSPLVERKQSALLWRIAHDTEWLGCHAARYLRRKDPEAAESKLNSGELDCPHCRRPDKEETWSHMIVECPLAEAVWDEAETIFKRAHGFWFPRHDDFKMLGPWRTHRYELLIADKKDDHSRSCLTILFHLARWTLWTLRCRARFDHTTIHPTHAVAHFRSLVLNRARQDTFTCRKNNELKTSPGFHKLWGNALAIEPDSTLQKMILVLCDDQNVVSTPDIISGLQMFD